MHPIPGATNTHTHTHTHTHTNTHSHTLTHTLTHTQVLRRVLRATHCADLRTLPPGHHRHHLQRIRQNVAPGLPHVRPLQRSAAVHLLPTGPQAGRALLLVLHQGCTAAGQPSKTWGVGFFGQRAGGWDGGRRGCEDARVPVGEPRG